MGVGAGKARLGAWEPMAASPTGTGARRRQPDVETEAPADDY